ncbi:hypothetical protein ABIC65_002989 [Sphingomonas trueperi]
MQALVADTPTLAIPNPLWPWKRLNGTASDVLSTLAPK